MPSTSTMTRGMDWTAVAVVVISGFVACLQVGKGAIATPWVQAAFRIDLGAAGWLTAAIAALGLAGGIPAGAIVARIGDRRCLMFGLGTIFVGAVLGAAAPSFPVLVASRVVEGLGFLLVTVAGPAVLQRVTEPRHLNASLALWSCVMPAGMAAAMLAGSAAGDWRTLWWGGAALAAIAGIMTGMVVTGSGTGEAPSWSGLGRDAALTLRRRGPALLAACFALYALMFFALFSFLPILLMERMAVAASVAGPLSALAVGVNLVGNLAAGYLLSRGVGRSALIAGASLVMGLCALGIFLPLLGTGPVFLLCLLFSAIGGLIPATLLSSAPLLAPSGHLVAMVVGLMMQGSNLGQLVGPVAVGGVIGAYGWPAAAGAVGVAAALAIVAALALGAAFRRRATRSIAPSDVVS
ncbi:MFS transporter [Arenibaculum pallidiluteum]|uniref:MFS transporter n=1 Tax=Arenibaculum pallidiluteum TaxID=2812559 RepID=UPI001A978BFD|nr:MFS transporter [Arenibaculum pallidiluteum]